MIRKHLIFEKEDPFIDTTGAGYWWNNEIHLVST